MRTAAFVRCNGAILIYCTIINLSWKINASTKISILNVNTRTIKVILISKLQLDWIKSPESKLEEWRKSQLTLRWYDLYNGETITNCYGQLGMAY